MQVAPISPMRRGLKRRRSKACRSGRYCCTDLPDEEGTETHQQPLEVRRPERCTDLPDEEGTETHAKTHASGVHLSKLHRSPR